MLAAVKPFSPPKRASSFWRRLASDPGDALQRGGAARLGAPTPVTGDGEAVRLVADLLNQMQAGMILRQPQGFVAPRHDQLLQARLALLALRHADHGDLPEPELLQDRRARSTPAPCRRR